MINIPLEELVDTICALGTDERNTLLVSRISAQLYPGRKLPQKQITNVSKTEKQSRKNKKCDV